MPSNIRQSFVMSSATRPKNGKKPLSQAIMVPSQSNLRKRKPSPEHLLNLQGPPQSEAASGLVIEDNLSLVAHGALSQPLEEFAHPVLAFDYGAKTPDGGHDLQVGIVDIYRNQFELQTGFARQRTNGSGKHNLARNTRARGNRSLTADDDIPIQRGRKALARRARLRAELLAEANGQRGPSRNNKCWCRRGCIIG
jgi:hypothetical protein